jgi:hypothetical protein
MFIPHFTLWNAEEDGHVIRGGNYLVCRNGRLQEFLGRCLYKGITNLSLIKVSVFWDVIPSSIEDKY